MTHSHASETRNDLIPFIVQYLLKIFHVILNASSDATRVSLAPCKVQSLVLKSSNQDTVPLDYVSVTFTFHDHRSICKAGSERGRGERAKQRDEAPQPAAGKIVRVGEVEGFLIRQNMRKSKQDRRKASDVSIG